MADIEALRILEELRVLVFDKLQVVSYKWLSRYFLVSSNDAKRLLQEFVEKNGSELVVVYALSGWLKNDPSIYQIRLVSTSKIDAKQEFEESCSIQIYSVQCGMPKDPAVLWNAEYVQTEEFFKQPPKVNNCLRDNRFCGVSNSFAERNMQGTPVNIPDVPAKNVNVGGLPTGTTGSSQLERKIQQTTSLISLQSFSTITDIKNGSNGEGNKPVADNVNNEPPNNTKKIDSSFSSKGSLADMWGRASLKLKSNCIAAQDNDSKICFLEAVEDGNREDDGQDVHFQRTASGEGGRKRRVVFDFSDEEDEYKDNLTFPDKHKHLQQYLKTSECKSNDLNFENQEKNMEKIKEEEGSGKTSKLEEECPAISECKYAGNFSSDNIHDTISKDDANAVNKERKAAHNSPTRRKVLKSRIDDRGREVTEVVWEDEERKPDAEITLQADISKLDNTCSRPQATKKSFAPGSTGPAAVAGKAGSKKAGNRDPKQGNILSFFKRT